MQTVNEKQLLQAFRSMLRIRVIEEEIANRYSQQKMRCPIHLSIGQEAIAAGVSEHLLKSDYVISNHRCHAHYLAKGGDLKSMIAEMHGKATGCTSGKGGSMHLIDLAANVIGTTPIVGGSMPIGVGVAFASYLKDEPHLTALFFGEAATEEGVWAECLNFAALHALPIAFICENNFYSCYSPMEVRQSPKRHRGAIAEAHGIKAFMGEGNHLQEVYDIAEQGFAHIRAGRGPCYMEFTTYRYREHCGPFIDPAGYRPTEEEQFWQSRCPIQLAVQELQLAPESVEEYKAQFKQEVDEAFAFAEASPFPTYHPEECIYA